MKKKSFAVLLAISLLFLNTGFLYAAEETENEVPIAEESVQDSEEASDAEIQTDSVSEETETTAKTEAAEGVTPADKAGNIVDSGSCGTGVTWTLSGTDSDLTLTISGKGDMDDYTNTSNIPWVAKKDQITTIVVEKGVARIGKYAFSYCSNLTNVQIADGVGSLGGGAFYQCSRLSGIKLPDSIFKIGFYAFYQCSSLTSIKIPAAVESIGYDAFAYCSNLADVEISDGVMGIESCAFSYCTSLTSIVIPDSVTSLGYGAFQGCTNLINIKLSNNLALIGNNTFSDCRSLTDIEIPSSVRSLGDQSFSGCTGLTGIVIPDNLKTIGYQAFSGCSSLTNIVIPSKVTSVGKYFISGCTSLSDVTILDGMKTIGNNAFSNNGGPTRVIIPASVTYIEDFAFKNFKGTLFVVSGSYAETYAINKKIPYQVTCDHVWDTEYTVDLEPTFTEEGLESIHCTICGESQEGSERSIPRLVRVILSAASVNFADVIGLNYKIEMPEDLSNDPNAYVEYTFAGQTTTLKLSEMAVNSNDQRVLTVKVWPKLAHEKITVRFYRGDGTLIPAFTAKGVDVTQGHEYSVAEYCNAVRASGSTSATMKDLALKLEQYCAYAQKYLQYKPDEAHCTLDLSGVTTSETAAYAGSTSGSLDGLSLGAISFNFEEASEVNLKFRPASGAMTDDYEFAVDGNRADSVQSGGNYIVTIKGITAPQLGTYHIVTAKDSDGNTLTVRVCGLSYAHSILKSASSSSDAKDVVRAMFLYYQAAKEHFDH